MAHEQSAAFEGNVPFQTEVFAVDARFSGEPGHLLAQWILASSVEGGLEDDLARDVLDRQVANHSILVVVPTVDATALERNDGVSLRVEKIFGAQMGIALLIPSMNAFGVNDRLHGGLRWIGFVRAVDRPRTSLKRPRTVVSNMCFTENSTRLYF